MATVYGLQKSNEAVQLTILRHRLIESGNLALTVDRKLPTIPTSSFCMKNDRKETFELSISDEGIPIYERKPPYADRDTRLRRSIDNNTKISERPILMPTDEHPQTWVTS